MQAELVEAVNLQFVMRQQQGFDFSWTMLMELPHQARNLLTSKYKKFLQAGSVPTFLRRMSELVSIMPSYLEYLSCLGGKWRVFYLGRHKYLPCNGYITIRSFSVHAISLFAKGNSHWSRAPILYHARDDFEWPVITQVSCGSEHAVKFRRRIYWSNNLYLLRLHSMKSNKQFVDSMLLRRTRSLARKICNLLNAAHRC